MAEVLALDPVALVDVGAEGLESALVSWSSTMAASEFRWLRLVAEYDRRRLYERWECQTCAQWLMWHCSLDLRAAHEKVRVARALESMPIVAAAFERGELSYSKVRAITRVAYPDIEQGLVDTAKSIHTAGLERIVAGIRRARVLNNPDRPDLEPGMRRFVRSRSHEDGTVTLTVRLPAEEHAVLVKAIDAVVEPSKDRDIEQRRADALLEVAARALAATSTTSTADRYQVVVRVDADVLTGDNPTGECHLDGGDAISAETARRLCCDGSVIHLYENVDGQPVAVSAKTRTVPAAMRRALHARDGTCRFPGCTHRGWLDAHHQHHWADGGPTNLDNLLLLCRHHHRNVHEGGWTVQRNNDNDGDRGGGGGGGWTFTNPNGWSPQQPPTTEPHDIELGLPDDLDPHAVRPYWIDRPHNPYIISLFADSPPPDPQWN
ncbi:MAG: DUF222 domain-containing protein [Acidimicrobiia bacterium]